MKKHTSIHKGFTLIELLVVIAIIAILSATILVALNSARLKAKAAKAQSEMSDLRAQMELFYDSNGDCADGGFSSSAGNDNANKLITAITADTVSGTMVCNVEADDWSVSATLQGGESWCVDSNGGSENAVVTSGLYQCP